jgi:hypothetical protein
MSLKTCNIYDSVGTAFKRPYRLRLKSSQPSRATTNSHALSSWLKRMREKMVFGLRMTDTKMGMGETIFHYKDSCSWTFQSLNY